MSRLTTANNITYGINAQNNATGPLRQVEQSLGRVGKQTAALKNPFVAAAGAVTAAYAAFNQARAALEAFAVQEKAVRLLGVALEQSGANARTALPDLMSFAGALQEITVFGDEGTLQAQRYALNLGFTARELKGATQAAIGLSTAFDVDLNEAFKKLAEARAGEVDALAEYIPQLRTMTDATEKMALVNETARKGFEQAQEVATTYSGRMQQLDNSIGDLHEELGRGLAPTITDIADRFLDATPAVTQFTNDLVSGFEAVIDVAGKVTGVLSKITDGVIAAAGTAYDVAAGSAGAAYYGLRSSLDNEYSDAEAAADRATFKERFSSVGDLRRFDTLRRPDAPNDDRPSETIEDARSFEGVRRRSSSGSDPLSQTQQLLRGLGELRRRVGDAVQESVRNAPAATAEVMTEVATIPEGSGTGLQAAIAQASARAATEAIAGTGLAEAAGVSAAGLRATEGRFLSGRGGDGGQRTQEDQLRAIRALKAENIEQKKILRDLLQSQDGLRKSFEQLQVWQGS